MSDGPVLYDPSCPRCTDLATEVAQLRAKLARIQDAWRNPGPRPDVHAAAKAQLAATWPVLYDAVLGTL